MGWQPTLAPDDLKAWLATAVVVALATAYLVHAYAASSRKRRIAPSFFDLACAGPDGAPVFLADRKGKTTLVCNVASRSPKAPVHYRELCDLSKQYAARGFEVLAFPCAQFGGMPEEGADDDAGAAAARDFADLVRAPVGLRLMGRVDVEGADESPVFAFLKARCPLPRLLSDFHVYYLVRADGRVTAHRGPPSALLNDVQQAVSR